MRIGIACPYSWDVPGGVGVHIRDLAEEPLRRGHDVGVVAPSEAKSPIPDYLTVTGSAISTPCNGLIARLTFGPHVNREVCAWLRGGGSDVVHVHELFISSVSILALMSAECPVVSTFHTAMDRSRTFEVFTPVLRPVLEKIQARIVVSQEAWRTAVQYLGGDAFVIPNGVYTRQFVEATRDGRFTGTPGRPMLGLPDRIDEPRKGLPVVTHAFPVAREAPPGVRLFVAGRGDIDKARRLLGPHAEAVGLFGGVSDADKAALLSSVDVYLAPNIGGESFGIILVKAMSAGGFVVASDIPTFRAILGNGAFGSQFTNEDSDGLADAVVKAMDDPARRASVTAPAQEEAGRYDWHTVVSQTYAVYETAVRTAGMEVED